MNHLASTRYKAHQQDDNLNRLNYQLQEFHFQVCTLNVRERNSRLSNPMLPITPAGMRHIVKGIIEPDPNLFPRNANVFYHLEKPKTKHQRTMLAYLVGFYGIQSIMDAGSDEDISSWHKVPIIEQPDLAVAMLEGILGLRKQNFFEAWSRLHSEA